MDYLQGKTLPELIRYVVTNIHPPEHPCLLYRGAKQYEPISYREVLDKADAISAWLLEAGIKKGDRLGLLLDNSPEYVYFDQALQQIGAVNVSVYPTLPEKDTAYILNDSGVKTLLVGSPFLLKKVLKIAGQCPALRYIIPTFKDNRAGKDAGAGSGGKPAAEGTAAAERTIITLGELINEGKAALGRRKAEIEARRAEIRETDLASLIYTSGTTGIPKGTMLTHANFVKNVKACLEQLPRAIDKNDTFLSFLPLSHVFERTATYHVCLAMGCKIAFAESLESLGRNMTEVHPTVMNVVPRLLEKIRDKVYKNATEGGGIKAKIFHWALDTGKKAREIRERGKTPSAWLALQLSLAEKLVFRKIKEKTGGSLKFMISGGGAMPVSVGEFFSNLGIVVLEGYGLTETSPVVAVNLYEKQAIGTVGPVIPDIEIGIQHVETQELLTVQTHDSHDPAFNSAEGEILVRGHCVMKGYWHKPAETQAAIDSDGWFHTGDVGCFDRGNLKITDRIKNMLVNAFGKNIYPTPVENVYMRSNKIEQIFLIGDKQEYVTAILVPNKELLMQSFGLEETFFEQPDMFIDDERIIAWMNEDIRELSTELAKFERIRNFAVKRNPFTIDDGEMTPTLKIKRKVVEEKYAGVIGKLYRQPSVV